MEEQNMDYTISKYGLFRKELFSNTYNKNNKIIFVLDRSKLICLQNQIALKYYLLQDLMGARPDIIKAYNFKEIPESLTIYYMVIKDGLNCSVSTGLYSLENKSILTKVGFKNFNNQYKCFEKTY